MSALLLDTHVLLWWLADEPKLGRAARERIDDIDLPVFVSAASGWEISIKRALGKLSAPENLTAVLKEEGFESLSVEMHHGEAAGALPPIHRDPFDRMLIAQGVAESLLLVTADANVMAYGTPTLDATG